jgi:hypothetical protein
LLLQLDGVPLVQLLLTRLETVAVMLFHQSMSRAEMPLTEAAVANPA